MTITLQRDEDGIWSDGNTKDIVLPPSTNANSSSQITVSAGTGIAFVGANGAGKSRMAAWIDQHNENVVYIRARRSIVMPNHYSISPTDQELINILAGQKINITDAKQAKQVRYQARNDIYADNDFQHVLNILGSLHATTAIRFQNQYDATRPPKEKPKSPLAASIDIWSEILPHLLIDSERAPELRVSSKHSPDSYFKPSEMSDGEKAVFYLVAKCMIAPNDSIILVDEPEMYVHRSIRSRLWNNIEKKPLIVSLLISLMT